MSIIGMTGGGPGFLVAALLISLLISLALLLPVLLIVALSWYIAGKKPAAMKLGIPSGVLFTAMVAYLVMHWND